LHPWQLLGCAFGYLRLPGKWNCGLHVRSETELTPCGAAQRDGRGVGCSSCVHHWNGNKPWSSQDPRETSETVLFPEHWATAAELAARGDRCAELRETIRPLVARATRTKTDATARDVLEEARVGGLFASRGALRSAFDVPAAYSKRGRRVAREALLALMDGAPAG